MQINFSIVMPNYNSLHLKRAIKSVVNQKYDNWELIIIDNYSTIPSEEIVNYFNNKKIFYYKFNNNGNIAKARNYGIKKARYPWIAFLDSDDFWDSQKLLKVSKKIISNKSDIYYHAVAYSKKNQLFSKKIKDKSQELKKPFFENLIENGNYLANSSVVVKKNSLIEINFLDENKLKYSWEDYDCWLRLSLKNKTFYFIDDCLGQCWLGQGRVSNIKQDYINCKNIVKVYKEKFTHYSNKNTCRPEWINSIYFNYFYNKKNYLRSMYFLKKLNRYSLGFLLKKIHIIFYFIFKKKILFNFRKIIFKIKKIKNFIVIYEHRLKDSSLPKKNITNHEFKFDLINNYEAFCKFKNLEIFRNQRECYLRLKKKHCLATISIKEKIVSYGWCCKDTPFKITEIDKLIYHSNIILYDFFTLDTYRNRGLYKGLLNNIIVQYNQPLIIYSLKANIVSNHVIKAVGFKKIKTLNILSNDYIKKNN